MMTYHCAVCRASLIKKSQWEIELFDCPSQDHSYRIMTNLNSITFEKICFDIYQIDYNYESCILTISKKNYSNYQTFILKESFNNPNKIITIEQADNFLIMS